MVWRAVLAVAVVLVAFVLAGCRADVGVVVDVNSNGGGRVRVEVVVDKDVTDRIDLPTVLKVDDLVQAGWKVTGPERRPGNATAVVATKGFADPAGAARVFAEISGPDGPFQGFAITRSGGFFSTKTSLRGAVDLNKGIEDFTDPALLQALGGVGALQQLLGQPVGDAVHLQVSVHLPGRSATYAPAFGQRTDLRVDAHRVDLVHVTAVVAVIVAIAGLLVFAASRRRDRGAHAN